MFRSFIYLDNRSISNYSIQLGISPSFKVKSAGGSLGASAMGLSAGISLEGERASEGDSLINAYDTLEKRLKEHSGVDYFDFLDDDPDEMTLPSMSLFRFRGTAKVPEEFDLLDTIRKFAPVMKDAGLLGSMVREDVATEVAFGLLSDANARVPLIVDGLEVTVSTKLDVQYLSENDALVLEDLEVEEAVFLCKVLSHHKEGSVPIYDPLKDFMKLNRSLRRSMKRSQGLEIICEDAPVLKAEVIAIYH